MFAVSLALIAFWSSKSGFIALLDGLTFGACGACAGWAAVLDWAAAGAETAVRASATVANMSFIEIFSSRGQNDGSASKNGGDLDL